MDFTDMLKRALGGGIFGSSPEEEEEKKRREAAAQAGAVPLGGALPAAEEKPGFFSSLMNPSDEQRQDRRDFLLPMGAAMMVAGGPSNQPTNLLSVVGSGLGAGITNQAEARKLGLVASKAKAEAATAEQRALASAQLKEILADVGATGFTPEKLAKIAELAHAAGDDATYRDAIGMIQQLQQTAAKSGMVVGEDGAMRLADGYGESLNETERQKSSGRKEGEQPYATTTDLTELDRINRERAAAGQEPLSAETFLADQAKRKQTNINLDSGASNKQVFDEMSKRRELAQASADALPGIARARKALNDGGIFGGGADKIMQLQKIADVFGAADTDKIANTETFQVAMAPIFSSVKAALVGNAQFSDADRAFVERMSGMNPNLDPVSIGRMLDIFEKVSHQKVDQYNQTLDGVYAKDNEQVAQTRALLSLNITPVDIEEDKPVEKPAKVFGVDTAVTQEVEETPIEVPTVNTQEEWNKVPSGTVVIYKGKKYRNP